MLTDRERHVMRHALGLTRRKTSYRNYYFAYRGSHAFEVWLGLLERGLAAETYEIEGAWKVFVVTDAGRAALSPQEGRGSGRGGDGAD